MTVKKPEIFDAIINELRNDRGLGGERAHGKRFEGAGSGGGPAD